MAPKIRFLFFPSRSIGYNHQRYHNFVNNIFPPEWEIIYLFRKPMPSTGLSANIQAVDLYDSYDYTQKVTDLDIEEEEKWLGFSFNSIIYMEDLYFHTEFKPTLQKKKNIVKHIRAFRKIIQEHDINLVLIGYPGEITDITLYYVVKRLGLAYFDTFMPFTLSNALSNEMKYTCFRDNAPIPINTAKQDKVLIGKISRQLRKNIQSRNKIFLSEVQNDTDRNFGWSLQTFKWKWQQLKEILNNQSPYESQFNFRDLTWVYLRSFFNTKINNTLFHRYLFEQPRAGERYFYFPLHFPRDASISFKEPFLSQTELIKHLSYSLPHKVKLYVKCHPNYKASDFTFWQFRAMKKLKNVRLINHQTNNLELISKAQGIITINSTTGLEAIALGKPVITFGDEFYARKNISIPVKDLKELRTILVQVLNNPEYQIDSAARNEFLYHYYLNSFPLKGHILWDVGEELQEGQNDIVRATARKMAEVLFNKGKKTI